MKWTYKVTIDQTINIRDFLHLKLMIPKHLIFNLRRQKRVLVNGDYRPMNFTVNHGDRLQLTFLVDDFKHPFPNVFPTLNHAIEVLYQTNDLLVINKPSGIKTHPNQPDESGSALNIAAGYLEAHHQIPYIINRLDMLTSGALLFAKNPAVVPPLTQLIKTKKIQRTYLAWVEGQMPVSNGTIEFPIGRDPKDKRKRKVNGTNALPATTHYQVIKTMPNQTLLKIRLETGRTHQIRVHLAAINHPIIGDPLYQPNYDPSGPRLQLHSWQIALIRPFSDQRPLITAPIPADFM